MGAWRVVAAGAILFVVGAAGYLAVVGDWLVADVRAALRRRITWLVGIPTLLAVFLVGVPYVYLQAVTGSSPPPLTFADLPDDVPDAALALPEASSSAAADTELTPVEPVGESTTTSSTPVAPTATSATTAPGLEIAGAWTVGPGSQARYGIDDTILGQRERVVGRTDQVSGSMVVAGTSVSEARIVVDMRSVRCGCVHDQKYHDLLHTERYPTATFELTRPIELGPALPPEGTVIEVPVTGSFTIHGTTRPVSFTLQALRRGGRIAVNGTIPIRLEDYGIENPSAGPLGGLSNPAIELLVAFDRT